MLSFFKTFELNQRILCRKSIIYGKVTSNSINERTSFMYLLSYSRLKSILSKLPKLHTKRFNWIIKYFIFRLDYRRLSIKELD